MRKIGRKIAIENLFGQMGVLGSMVSKNKNVVCEFWRRVFPGNLPLASDLRINENENWFRLHSLPMGKRYSTTDQERHMILKFYDSVAREVFDGEYSKILILIPLPQYGKKFQIFNRYKESKIISSGFTENFTIGNIKDENKYKIFYREDIYVEFDTDSIYNFIANDELMQSIFWNFGDSLFCPYDGGIDLIIFNKEKMNNLKRKFVENLSNHPLGL